MKISTVAGAFMAAAIGLTLCSEAVSAHDFSAAINAAQTGIDLYAIDDAGKTLVVGSPFRPTKLPYPMGGNTVVVPVMVQLSTEHHYLYVIYAQQYGIPNILVQYSVTWNGLIENWAVLTKLSGADDLNHAEYVLPMVATGNNIIVYYHYPWGAFAEIYTAAGKLLAQAGSDPSTQANLESVGLSPDDAFYYACFQSTTQASVSVYELPSGKMVQSSTDPTFVASECGEP